MIVVTKINDKEITINNDLIEMIESTPDTTITMSTGKKIIVRESVEEIVARVVEFRKSVSNPYKT